MSPWIPCLNAHSYWIEGPTGEDIRSAWRGQAVHELAIKALLHPRATNLPPHVQSTYLQSTMKIFIQACLDCEESAVAAAIGTLRSHLSVFLQSPHVEVQERASTLRHLLAEFEILSMTWEAAAEEVKSDEKEARAKAGPGGLLEADLLDLPMYTPGSVKAVDDLGSVTAKHKKRVLAAVVKEAFYAVHAKAQRKVPVPEGLDLDAPFNSSALNKLLSYEIPENLTIATLSLTAVVPPIPDHGKDDEDDSRLSRLSGAFAAEGDDRGFSSYSSFQGDHGAMKAGTHGRREEDSMFYLAPGRSTSDVIPLSQILADTFEDKKTKKGKKDKKDKSKKVKSAEVDTREMLPAGAMSSDDEGGGGSKKKKGATRSRRKGNEVR